MSNRDNDTDDTDETSNTDNPRYWLDPVTAMAFATFEAAVPRSIREHDATLVRAAVRVGYLLALLACARVRADDRTTATLGDIYDTLCQSRADYANGFDSVVETVAGVLREASMLPEVGSRLN